MSRKTRLNRHIAMFRAAYRHLLKENIKLREGNHKKKRKQLVLTDYHKMIYLMEIIGQCDNAIRIFEDRIIPYTPAAGTKYLFMDLHGFLTHLANVSKLLWPTKPTSARRGRLLRELIGVDHRQPLRRTLRNHLEHYDERLDDWVGRGEGYVDQNIGPPGAFSAGSTPMRNFNPATSEYSFRGRHFDIQSIFQEANDIHQKALTALEKIEPMFAVHYGAHPS